MRLILAKTKAATLQPDHMWEMQIPEIYHNEVVDLISKLFRHSANDTHGSKLDLAHNSRWELQE